MFIKRRRKTTTGFTLIELLVVIAIIGLLASVILASLSSARAAARDAERLSDMRQIRTAMIMYYSEHGEFPQIPKPGQHIGVGKSIDSMLAPYLDEIPRDPLETIGDSYYYAYDSAHCVSSAPTNSDVHAIISVNHFETIPRDSPKLHRDTNCGGNQNIDDSDYNTALGLGPWNS